MDAFAEEAGPDISEIPGDLDHPRALGLVAGHASGHGESSLCVI